MTAAHAKYELIRLEQGSPEWHALRKTKITATDAVVIMGASPWKTRTQLYNEKLSPTEELTTNERMQRGIDLEPVARDLFNLTTGNKMVPKVAVKGWAMASLDGMNDWDEVLEIKCPGEKAHATALSGKVPDYYYPQLQHQMYVCNAQKVFYYSFDGFDGVTVEVKRDDAYIEKMVEEELKFYECLISKTPPEQSETEYVERMDEEWNTWATQWMSVTSQMKHLEKEEEELRKQLITLSGASNARGAGIALCQVQRKGTVDYAKIPQLKGLDLEQYRKAPSNSWRITCS